MNRKATIASVASLTIVVAAAGVALASTTGFKARTARAGTAAAVVPIPAPAEPSVVTVYVDDPSPEAATPVAATPVAATTVPEVPPTVSPPTTTSTLPPQCTASDDGLTEAQKQAREAFCHAFGA
jgi:hypothetical protein